MDKDKTGTEDRAAGQERGGVDWSNVTHYSQQDYLTDDAFLDVKRKIHRCWRAFGMLHLRMENDVDRNRRNKTPIPQILAAVDEAEALLQAIRTECEQNHR